MDGRVEVAGLGDRTLEQEADHVELRLPYQLYHFRRQKVSILLEESFGLINNTPGKVMNRETNCIGFWPDVELGFNVVVKFLCRSINHHNNDNRVYISISTR